MKHVVTVLGIGAALTLVVAAGAGRTAAAFPVDSFFDVFTESSTTQGPPYPSDPPILIGVVNETAKGLVETEIVALSLMSGPPDVPVRIEARGGGGSGGTNRFFVESFFDVFFDIDPKGVFPAESFFDVFVEIDLPDGGPAMGKVTQVSVLTVDSFFDVFYEIDLADGGHQALNFSGTPGPGLKLSRVKVRDDFVVDSFFDVFTELSVDGSGPVDPTQPVMTMRMSGFYTPEPGTVVMLLGAGLIGLVACGRRRRKN